MFADEPEDVGGLDSGPSPYDFLAVALAACTSMTLRIYAAFKKLDVGTISVDVAHDKVHAKDCQDCAEELRDRPGKIDRFERRITVAGGIDEALEKKLLEIADKCPVHRTLEKGAAVVTKIAAE
jgi:putative redox protein